MFRVAARTPSVLLRSASPLASFSRASSHAATESFDEFNARYASFFQSTNDLFELQRGLNNCFAYDLVPSQAVVEEAIRAARRVNDYSTAVRIFQGLKEKTDSASLYAQYVDATAPLRAELGITLHEELYPSAK
ncbi:hypothetical protein MNV49_005328 [Pseudohyphozyma bogoriensis]|nr:hypothetical protein MNV49_005328 [Pseudohyphozyma bogoriensis]